MKNLSIIILFLSAILSFSSCKTTEENYRAAYELAKKKDSGSPVDSTIYARIRNEARPQAVAVGNDTLRMKTEYVALTPETGGTADRFKTYNIVVAQFKQLFNAKSVRKRIAAAGYNDAFIIQTREPLYYVVAVSSSSPAEALESLKRIEADRPVVMKDPCPFVVRKP